MTTPTQVRSALASQAYDHLATALREGNETAIAPARMAVVCGVSVASVAVLADMCELIAAMAAAEISP